MLLALSFVANGCHRFSHEFVWYAAEWRQFCALCSLSRRKRLHQGLCTCKTLPKTGCKGSFDRLSFCCVLFRGVLVGIRCGNGVGHIAEHISSTHVHTERQVYARKGEKRDEFGSDGGVIRRLNDQTYNFSSPGEFMTIQAAEEAGYTRPIRIKVGLSSANQAAMRCEAWFHVVDA
jgi:hypothetical protein